MRILTEGFEAGIGGWSSRSGSVTVTQTNARISGYCAAIGSGAYIHYAIQSLPELYVTFALRREAGESQFSWYFGTTGLGFLLFDSLASKIRVFVGGSQVAEGSRVCPWNEWFIIQAYIRIGDSNYGRIVVKVDGVTDVDFTGETAPEWEETVINGL